MGARRRSRRTTVLRHGAAAIAFVLVEECQLAARLVIQLVGAVRLFFHFQGPSSIRSSSMPSSLMRFARDSPLLRRPRISPGGLDQVGVAPGATGSCGRWPGMPCRSAPSRTCATKSSSRRSGEGRGYGRAPCKGGAFQWVQIPSGNRSSRKQSEQSWR